MERKERHAHSCTRCGYLWVSALEMPKRCSGCKSPYWNKARTRLVRPKIVENAEKIKIENLAE